jgi:predicted outer membrane repeat protein
VESCIFSNNRTTSSGGAIYSNSGNTLTVRGSTFYDNRASGTLANGGAIYALGNLNLTGNVFYDNTAPNVLTPSVIYHSTLFGGTVTSGGFNVVDMTMGTGTGQAGFDAHSSDRTLATLLGSNNTSPFVSWLLGDFTPVAGLNAVITSAPADFPVTDFKGAARTFPGAPGAIKQP